MKISTIIIFCLILLTPKVYAAELITKNYVISITSNCEEGNVSCDDVTYIGTHKKNGKSIRLKGSTWHTTCADGVTPCQFVGYIFKNADTVYALYEKGLLEVSVKGKILLREEGIWKY